MTIEDIMKQMSDLDMYESLIATEIASFIMSGLVPEQRTDRTFQTVAKAATEFTIDLSKRFNFTPMPRLIMEAEFKRLQNISITSTDVEVVSNKNDNDWN